ncbi:MAG TPA: hypothetical protein VIH58_12340, partial [Chthoniobacterales bacterium]
MKTCTRRERAELFSLFSSSDGDWQIASFLIQRNRDKLSTRKFDVGVFTQLGTFPICRSGLTMSVPNRRERLLVALAKALSTSNASSF